MKTLQKLTVLALLTVSLNIYSQPDTNQITAGKTLISAGINIQSGIVIGIASGVLAGVLITSGVGTAGGVIMIIGFISSTGCLMTGSGKLKRAGRELQGIERKAPRQKEIDGVYYY